VNDPELVGQAELKKSGMKLEVSAVYLLTLHSIAKVLLVTAGVR
jgi:hypothetical protein